MILRIISANKILVSSTKTLVNHALVLDDGGVIVEILPMTTEVHERPFVLFYSGLITPPVAEWHAGVSLSGSVVDAIAKGYDGELWLWQGVDYETLIPSERAEFKVL